MSDLDDKRMFRVSKELDVLARHLRVGGKAVENVPERLEKMARELRGEPEPEAKPPGGWRDEEMKK